MTIILVLGVYAAVLLIVAIWSRRPQEETGLIGYFLAGRQLGLFLFMGTFVGTAFSTASTVGVPGYIYSHGVGAAIAVFLGMSLMGLCGVWYGKKLVGLRESRDTYSPIHIVSRRYRSPALGVVCALVTLCFSVPHLVVQVVGIGRLTTPFLGKSVEPWVLSLIVLTVVVLYSYVTGARGVARTDLVQTILIVLGLSLLAVLIVYQLGGLSRFLTTSAQRYPEFLALPGPTGFFTLPAFLSMILLVTSGSISQPRFSMRLIMTTDPRQFRALGLAMLLLSALVFSAAFVIGMGGRIWFPELASGDQVMGVVLTRMMESSQLLVAFLMLGIISAAMSTIDSQLLAISAIVTRDILKPCLGAARVEGRELPLSKIIVISVAVLTFLISLRPPELLLQMAFLALAGGLQLVPTYLMQFSARRSSPAALSSILGGLLTLLWFRVIPGQDGLGFDSGVIGFAVAWVVYLLVAFLTHDPARSSAPDSLS